MLFLHGILATLALTFGCARQPEKPLEMHLSLSKRQFKAGEFLWYKIELKNVGRKSVRIQDPFWRRQSVLFEWGTHSQTHFEITGPDGKPVGPLRLPWGYHGELHFWSNDCGGGQFCPRELTNIALKGGQTLTATPSMVRPIRPRNPDALDDPGDPRALPAIPPGLSKEQAAALPAKWKTTVEQSGWLMGDPTFRPDPKELPPPRDYRVLDGYIFDTPGVYKMKAVYLPFGYSKTLKDVESEEWNLRLSDYGWPKETRVFMFESNTVEFEIAPIPFPEHLFRKHSGVKETPESLAYKQLVQKKLKEVMERTGSLKRP
jgi:hypothetical protein